MPRKRAVDQSRGRIALTHEELLAWLDRLNEAQARPRPFGDYRPGLRFDGARYTARRRGWRVA